MSNNIKLITLAFLLLQCHVEVGITWQDTTNRTLTKVINHAGEWRWCLTFVTTSNLSYLQKAFHPNTRENWEFKIQIHRLWEGHAHTVIITTLQGQTKWKYMATGIPFSQTAFIVRCSSYISKQKRTPKTHPFKNRVLLACVLTFGTVRVPYGCMSRMPREDVVMVHPWASCTLANLLALLQLPVEEQRG